MNIFIVGLPRSGRSTVAKALIENYPNWSYIDAVSWLRLEFRPQKDNEHLHQYEDEFQNSFTQKMLSNPSFVSERVNKLVLLDRNKSNFIIDGIISPKDFVSLFDYTKDVVVFLNRIDNDYDMVDHENIGISVIRDYCFWLASAGLINKNKWLEYNFKISGEQSEFVKALGSKNSVFIVKSIYKAISHLKERLNDLSK